MLFLNMIAYVKILSTMHQILIVVIFCNFHNIGNDHPLFAHRVLAALHVHPCARYTACASLCSLHCMCILVLAVLHVHPCARCTACASCARCTACASGVDPIRLDLMYTPAQLLDCK